jgi:hypothetical protein
MAKKGKYTYEWPRPMVTVDAVIYSQVTDPYRVLYNVEQFQIATLKLAQTNLRNVVGDLELDETLTSRDRINEQLREVLDTPRPDDEVYMAFDQWLTTLAVQEIRSQQMITLLEERIKKQQ